MMQKKCNRKIRRIVALLCALVTVAASLPHSVAFAAPEDRLTGDHLAAYYSFEDPGNPGKDYSGKNRHLKTFWGYAPEPVMTEADDLNLGVAGIFARKSSLSPAGGSFNTRDFLDDMDTYTLSFFFQNTSECAGGALFNNKFWAEDGVQITVNKWPDAAATGQVELYLDYNYLDTAGNSQFHHACVKFIPEGKNGVDTGWHHIALTVDKPNHTIALYFDGEKVHENSNMRELKVDCQQYPFTLGALVDPQWPSGDAAFDGALDEVRIYDFPVNAEEAVQLAANAVAAEKPKDDWQINKTPVLDQYDLYTYTLPYWEGDTVYHEQLLVRKNADGSVPTKSLLYPATEILSVRSRDLATVYEEGKDYVLQDGKLTFPAGSTIPMMDYDVYYPATATEGATFGKIGGGYILYTEQLQLWQISVSYKHSGSWNGTLPSYQGGYIPKTMEKLENKQPLKIVFYGDSITEGWCASGFQNQAPYTESWADMVTKMLRANYGYSDITMRNSALASTDTAWGVDDANLTPRVIDQNPDLVVIAFGMNDGNRSLDDYYNKIQGMITKVRAVNPNVEFLLVSSMLPNREVDWLATGNQPFYQQELVKLQAANEGVAVARVTDAYMTFAANKDYYDTSGNNVNHPNDSVVRLYAQTMLAAFLGETDSSTLADLIAQAESLAESQYTPASWADLMAALEQAKEVVDGQDQGLIDQQVQLLKAALDALEVVHRLTTDRLLAYYSFDDKNSIGKDLSGNGNHLAHGFWGDVVTLAPSGFPLGGSAGRLLAASVMTLENRAAYQADFLDNSQAYTLSLFFKMANGSRGGTLFNNKNWAEEGVKIALHTWEAPDAIGQVEVYLDYAYRDQSGNLRNYHQVVYFMPEAAGGGIDGAWHNIVLVVDRTQGIRFFFDGVEKDVRPAGQVSEYVLSCEKYTLGFGGCYDDEYANAQDPFNGWLDEICIYDFAVEADEAALLARNLNEKPAAEDAPVEENNRLVLSGQTDSGLGVQLEIPKEAVPADVTLQIVTAAAAKEKLEALYKDLICLEVSLISGDKALTALPEYANLIISGVTDWSGYKLLRMDGDVLEQIDFYTDMDGNASIYTRSLGTLVFVREGGSQNGGTAPVQTPPVWPWILAAAVLVAGAAAAVLVIYRKRTGASKG